MISVKRKIPVYGKGTERRYRFVFDCLSTDPKLSDNYRGDLIANGSVLTMIDKDKKQIFDEQNKTWFDYSEGGGGEIDPEDIATDEEIDQVIEELDPL